MSVYDNGIDRRYSPPPTPLPLPAQFLMPNGQPEAYPGQSQEQAVPNDFFSRLAGASGPHPFDFQVRSGATRSSASRGPNPIEIILGIAAAAGNFKASRAAHGIADVERKNALVRESAQRMRAHQQQLAEIKAREGSVITAIQQRQQGETTNAIDPNTGDAVIVPRVTAARGGMKPIEATKPAIDPQTGKPVLTPTSKQGGRTPVYPPKSAGGGGFGGGSGMGELPLDEMAALVRYSRASGKFVPMGMGNSPFRRQFMAEFARQEKGGESPLAVTQQSDLKSLNKSLADLTQLGAGLESYSGAASRNAALVNEVKGSVPDIATSPMFNRPLRSLAKGALGSVDVVRFRNAVHVAANEYGRLIENPRLVGQFSVQAQQEAKKLADPDNMSLAQIFGAFDVLARDAENRRASNNAAIKYIRESISGVGGKGSSIEFPPTGAGSDTTGAKRIHFDKQGNRVSGP